MPDVDVCLSCDLGEDNTSMKALHGFCDTCLGSGRATIYQIGILDIEFDVAERGWQRWCAINDMPVRKLTDAYPDVFDIVMQMRALRMMDNGFEKTDG